MFTVPLRCTRAPSLKTVTAAIGASRPLPSAICVSCSAARPSIVLYPVPPEDRSTVTTSAVIASGPYTVRGGDVGLEAARAETAELGRTARC